MFSLKIDLSKKDVFEDKELEINRNITFIFGKNGTGKSTIAKLIEEQEKGYDVRIFNGFDGVISENGELNAVILGEENTQIQKEISEKEKEIEKETIKKEEVLKQIQEPENKADKNVFTKFKNAEKEWESKKQEMENFFTESASKIKRKDNPQIAKTTYNKKDFKEELKKAERLDENKIKELKEIIKQEIKNPVNICFPALNLENYLKKTNEILATRVEEKTRISRLEGNREKREFAEQGYHIHKKGDICAFCGNEIQDEIFVELEKYFSSDEVKEFKEKIQVEKGRIEETIKEIDNIVIDKNQFYMEYEKEVEDLKEEFQSIKEKIFEVLYTLKDCLEKKDIFQKLEKKDIKVPLGFHEIENKYKELVNTNKKNNSKIKQTEAKEQLRLHEIQILLNEWKYDKKDSNLHNLEKNKYEKAKDLEEEKKKLIEIEEKISKIRLEIKELEAKTKNEKILAEKINKKLKYSVCFELQHCENTAGNGFYQVKCLRSGEIRKVTQLSTGEKNIVAFLYFMGKLEEEERTEKNKIIVFDDPMNSNDDTMQYIIIEELQTLMKKILKEKRDYFILLTHNKHFYLNVKYNIKYDKSTLFIRLQSNVNKTRCTEIKKKEDDFKTNYEAIWQDLRFLYHEPTANERLLLNPIRIINETFMNFNNIRKETFYKPTGAKKLFDVNSHSFDDLEAELNGKTKLQIMKLMKQCYEDNGALEHFKKYFTEDLDLEN